MNTEAPELARLAEALEALEALRAEISRLHDRVAALESTGANCAGTPAPVARETPTAPLPPPRAASPVIDEELILVLGAAVAAYLGCKPHIRQIRLLGGASWAQQGRVTVQASHALPVKHG